MVLLLPNLDDRTWADLSDEGRALIPVYGPEWTDHNVSDPGITLVELLASITEMQIYRLNQVSDPERLKFLALVGVTPAPPMPATAVMSIALAAGAAPVTLPKGLEFTGNDPSGTATRFRSLHDVTLAPGGLASLQMRDGAGFHNLTPAWRRAGTAQPFGAAPQTGTELYIGLSESLPVGVAVELYFTFGDGHSGEAERRRIADDARDLEQVCRPPRYLNPCQSTAATAAAVPASPAGDDDAPLRHYGVRTVWEYLASAADGGQWLPVDPAQGQLEDQTRAFTLDGAVKIRLSGAIAPGSIGMVPDTLYYLRCRFEAGRYDAAPVLQAIAFNGVRVAQAVPTGMSFAIDPLATISYGADGPPKPGDRTTLRMEINAQGRINRLTCGGGAPADPAFVILDYAAPFAPIAGRLSIEGVFLGFGNGFPDQKFTVPDAPVEYASFQLYTLENDDWLAWELRPDFDASRRTDRHALLDASTGVVRFGNGEKGRVPPEIRPQGGTAVEKCLVFAIACETRAAAGNLVTGTISQLANSMHNGAVLFDPAAPQGGWAALNAQLGSIANVAAASGGAAAETIDHAAGQADQSIDNSGRAVSLADHEQLALQTPGTRIARVKALANLHPAFPCLAAPGIVTVIVLPFLPAGRSVPTQGLLRAVRSYLSRRRVIGSRVEVVGPTYLDVAVQAGVQSLAGTNATILTQAIVDALNRFLDPLVGGPAGTGWPFGRSVYRAEIMRIIGAVTGVDYITSLDLIAGNSGPQCGNVCLGPTGLVVAGTHQITVA